MDLSAELAFVARHGATVRHGVSPYEALRSATARGARALGLSDRLGTVVGGGVPHTVAALTKGAVTEQSGSVRNTALPAGRGGVRRHNSHIRSSEPAHRTSITPLTP
ncbi:hypothetical protein Sipo8835_21885 [Streptomyces ipomoeae]|jgi:cytosine/adenosine deaminase-related metal-dependent hydrolase|uniref:Amidohydrolase-related domain-containing protein n=1 Tax=Streptomyces ipomoeae TaxID=103232 RepID=A0AAE8W0R7_9ACTN|nr:amidohydrolase family protein [Streptomyces ipomoeae]MDX2823094.1 amidohydrolase family protein [Streptomyces ipomoeae]MDX2876941.1 amidohydrolase family protein [Streptomyces ipomoeae]TQE27834.1 hypothetical protein Sipo7851_31740 [Streptomyces ipomoeae]TQE31734.1 hypothetical protein Sipo8835_21885 [Streptomyces ipomoeae]